MNNSGRRALDIALAAEARGMYAKLLTAEDKQRIAQARSTTEFLTLLQRSGAWRDAALMLQSGEQSDASFAEAVDRCIYSDFARLYRFANDMSRQFLTFITLDAELEAIMKAIRRVASPPPEGAKEPEPLPRALRDLPGSGIDKLARAKSFEDIVSAVAGTIYAKPLAALERDEKTGLPALSDTVTVLEARFFDALAGFVRSGYTGPAKKELTEAVVFRADLLNVTYLMRLRRFNTPPERLGSLLLPLRGALTEQTQRRVLAAGSDGEAYALLRSTRLGKYLLEGCGEGVESAVRAAQKSYFRKVLHGPLNLAAVYAFLTLKNIEGDMLRRVFTALSYGLDPADYMD